MRVVLALCLAVGCTDAPTVVRVGVSADSAWPIDQYQVRIGDAMAHSAPVPTLDVVVPDTMAGRPAEVVVWGLSGGHQIATGTASVTPELHGTVRADIALAMTSCAACEPGATRCEGDAVVTCEAGAGCPQWSTASPCPAAAPYCSNGACSATCVDECADGESACDGASQTRACGQVDADPCRDWTSPVTCAHGGFCEDGTCHESCDATTCVTPPDPTCVAANTLRTFTGPGTCGATGCTYASSDTTCSAGCVNGRCRGKADCVGRSSTGRLLVYRSTGTQFMTAEDWGPVYTATPLMFADVDGDGRSDLIRQGADSHVYVRRSTGTSLAPEADWGIGIATHYLDVTGDGRADALRIGSDKHAYVSVSTGTGFASETDWGVASATSTPVLADLDGDGRADTLSLWLNGSYVMHRSTGTVFAPAIDWGRFYDPDRLADVDGDRRADWIRPGVGDFSVYVGLSTGTMFAPETLWHPDLALRYDVLADVTGDGRGDALDVAGNGVRVFASTGSAFDLNGTAWGGCTTDLLSRRWVDIDGQ